MTPSEQDPPAVAAADPPRPGGQVVAVAVALLEAAALIAAMRGSRAGTRSYPCTRRPIGCGHHQQARTKRTGGPTRAHTRRTDPSTHAADVRLAVLVAEATIGRCLAKDGYLSARELSVDLRHAAAWLAAGAQFGP